MLLFSRPISLGPRNGRRSTKRNEELCSRRHDHGCRNARNGICREVGTRLIFMDGGVIVEEGHPKESREEHPQMGRNRSYQSINLIGESLICDDARIRAFVG